MDLWRLPPVLVFHFKRFWSEQKVTGNRFTTTRQKLGDYVDFPFDIDMRPYLLSRECNSASAQHSHEQTGSDTNSNNGSDDGDNLLYELVAVANHSGTLNYGHYTAHVRRGIPGKVPASKSSGSGENIGDPKPERYRWFVHDSVLLMHEMTFCCPTV